MRLFIYLNFNATIKTRGSAVTDEYARGLSVTAKLKLTKEQESLFKAITTPLRQHTALAYIANGYTNGSEAYRVACKKIKKKPANNHDSASSEILKFPEVVAFIDSVRLVAAESANIDAKYVLDRLKEIDELDILDIMEKDLSGFKSLDKWPKPWRTSISGLDLMTMSGDDNIESVIKKVKWPDKTKNLEMIGKHVNVKAWDKEEKAEPMGDIIINFTDAEKPSDD